MIPENLERGELDEEHITTKIHESYYIDKDISKRETESITGFSTIAIFPKL